MTFNLSKEKVVRIITFVIIAATTLHIFSHQYLAGKITSCGLHVAFGIVLAGSFILCIISLHKYAMIRMMKNSIELGTPLNPSITETVQYMWEKGCVCTIISTLYLSVITSVCIVSSPTNFITINPLLHGDNILNSIMIICLIGVIGVMIQSILGYEKNTCHIHHYKWWSLTNGIIAPLLTYAFFIKIIL